MDVATSRIALFTGIITDHRCDEGADQLPGPGGRSGHCVGLWVFMVTVLNVNHLMQHSARVACIYIDSILVSVLDS